MESTITHNTFLPQPIVLENMVSPNEKICDAAIMIRGTPKEKSYLSSSVTTPSRCTVDVIKCTIVENNYHALGVMVDQLDFSKPNSSRVVSSVW